MIITSYNRESYISKAIQSVLESTFQNFELIISDDCSQDGSYDIACHFAEIDDRIRVYKNEKNIGDYPNRILAIKLSKGNWIKFVDCDDYISKDCLHEMYSYSISTNSHFGICAPGVNHSKLIDARVAFESGFLFHYGPTGSFFSKLKYLELGGFVDRITVSDWHMWSRFALEGSVMIFPESLATWRDHDDNTLKSDAHFYGVIRYYLASKKEILFSEKYRILGFDGKNIYRKEYVNIFKLSIRFSLKIRSLKPLFFFMKYNVRHFIF